MKGPLTKPVLIAIAIPIAAAIFVLFPFEFRRTEPLFQGLVFTHILIGSLSMEDFDQELDKQSGMSF